ncbi:MAG: hypothetical protein QM772_08420 [Ottowia sp.]|uniref:hypothetical protein n=1 Tax=Ottowia sp. TaxID=1898956 RepID=UPI0039E2F654
MKKELLALDGRALEADKACNPAVPPGGAAGRGLLGAALAASLLACVNGAPPPDDGAEGLRGRAPLLAAAGAAHEAPAAPVPAEPASSAGAPVRPARPASSAASQAALAVSAPASAASAPQRPAVAESNGYTVRWLRPLANRADEDGVEVVPAGERGGLRLVVTSSGGIGAAELRPVRGVWPREVEVQFQYAEARPFEGLEGLRVQVSPWAHQSGDDLPGPPPDGFVVWQREGTLRVVLPEGWLRQRDTLRIAWVDRYRR